MLPRIAMPVTVPVPSPQEQVSTAASGHGRLPAPEALGNLRAAVLLRLLEAMMRQIEPGSNGNDAALQLLGVLFETLKELPARNGRDDEAYRRLSNLLSRLPPELRPQMERLLAAAFSTAPTRVLMEIIRNPGGPDARRLAQTLLASAGEMMDVQPPKRSQDLSASGARLPVPWRSERHDLPPGTANGAAGDSRALQATLRRLFGGGADLHPGRVGHNGGSGTTAPPAPLRAAGEAAAERPPADARANERQGEGARTTKTLQSGVSGTAFDDERLVPEAPHPQRMSRGGDGHEAGKAAGSTATRNPPAEAAAGAAAAHGESRAGHDGMLRLMAQIVANLTEDDALILRLLLQAPLPEPAAADASTELPLPEADDAVEARRVGVGLRTSEAKGPGLPADPSPVGATEGDADVASATAASRPKDGAETLPKGAPGGEPPARAAANTTLQPDRPAERPPVPLFGRDGLPVPFVPYPPPQDGLDTRKDAGRDETDEEMPDNTGKDEDEKHDAQDGDRDGPAQEEADAGPAPANDHTDQPDPGFAIYRKLGDDWA